MLAQFACIGTRAVEMATPLRRAGYSVETIWNGKRAKQYTKAEERAIDVLDSDKPDDWHWLDTFLKRPT